LYQYIQRRKYKLRNKGKGRGRINKKGIKEGVLLEVSVVNDFWYKGLQAS